jgi:hypothetical protein
MWLAFKAWIHGLASEHKLFRRSVLLWAVFIISWGTFQMFDDITLISSSAAAAYGTLAGLLTIVIGFYFKHRKDDS